MRRDGPGWSVPDRRSTPGPDSAAGRRRRPPRQGADPPLLGRPRGLGDRDPRRLPPARRPARRRRPRGGDLAAHADPPARHACDHRRERRGLRRRPGMGRRQRPLRRAIRRRLARPGVPRPRWALALGQPRRGAPRGRRVRGRRRGRGRLGRWRGDGRHRRRPLPAGSQAPPGSARGARLGRWRHRRPGREPRHRSGGADRRLRADTASRRPRLGSGSGRRARRVDPDDRLLARHLHRAALARAGLRRPRRRMVGVPSPRPAVACARRSDDRGDGTRAHRRRRDSGRAHRRLRPRRRRDDPADPACPGSPVPRRRHRRVPRDPGSRLPGPAHHEPPLPRRPRTPVPAVARRVRGQHRRRARPGAADRVETGAQCAAHAPPSHRRGTGWADRSRRPGAVQPTALAHQPPRRRGVELLQPRRGAPAP